jgi:hypothetical protein
VVDVIVPWLALRRRRRYRRQLAGRREGRDLCCTLHDAAIGGTQIQYRGSAACRLGFFFFFFLLEKDIRSWPGGTSRTGETGISCHRVRLFQAEFHLLISDFQESDIIKKGI